MVIAQARAESWMVPLIFRVDVAALLPPGCRSGLGGVAHEQTEACRSDWQDDVARRPILWRRRGLLYPGGGAVEWHRREAKHLTPP